MVTTDIDLDEDVMCSLLDSWVKENVSACSYSAYAENAEKIGCDLEEIQRAVGHAITNELVLKAIDHMMEKEKENAGS